MTGPPTAPAPPPNSPPPRARRSALTLALAGLAVSLSATPAAADSSACTHHFSGPQICIRLEGQGGRNAVTGIWTNPPRHVTSRAVSLYRNGQLIDTATATRSGKALTHSWPAEDAGTDTELCVKFRGSQRMACQTTR
ncbi:hypothetical protein OIE62_05970 [Streptomyces scopuliridis]|uniref:Uncharacterized protein n=1 Tax=Streptomyces scopuliridis TaxID=452529 RepID=A0ACD4ZV14_9ACTN|nr:hypothetical protein [Streptomyces scopuliridis]WSB37241.1 hypothetical protein OG949_33275 [Streptomyces scopuliridis]WSC01862.1 hypothetical protein OG835_35855 [Streptomyces scopuliridis]WSC04601.1 hypothetical protein OIE62_05970 [Streptomyces scopuliridis]